MRRVASRPVDARHLHVHEDDIRTGQLHLAHRLLAVDRLSDHLVRRQGLQQRAQPAAHHGVVVGEHDTDDGIGHRGILAPWPVRRPGIVHLFNPGDLPENEERARIRLRASGIDGGLITPE